MAVKKSLVKPDVLEYEVYETYGLEWTVQDTKNAAISVGSAIIGACVAYVLSSCT